MTKEVPYEEVDNLHNFVQNAVCSSYHAAVMDLLRGIRKESEYD